MTITEPVRTKLGEEDQAGIATVLKDGGDGDLTKEELIKFKAEASEIAKGAAYNVNERRFASEETRFCIWEGQSPDGRKHAEAQDGKPAFPFEGAMDARIRLADMIVNERVLILVAAALRNLPQVKGLELNDQALGHKLTTVLKWVLKNKLGSQYFRTITKLAQYQEADSPSGAVLGVWWEQESALEMRTLTKEEIKGALVQMFGLNPNVGMPGQQIQTAGPGAEQAKAQQFAEMWAQLDAQLQNPDKDGETAQSLQELVPHLSDSRARKVVKELRETDQASFPSPYLRVDQPLLCAYRVFEHIFFPTNTASVQGGRAFFIREWLTEVQLRERIVSDGYTEEFVTEALKHEAATGWPIYRRNPTQGDFMVIKQEESKEAYRGLYEINTVYYKAVNEDHIPGLYYFPFHFQVETPGRERRLLEYVHGEYPLVYFSREVLGERLLDSRGVPEVVATEQQALKLMADSFNDNVTLSTLPNIKVPRRRSKLALVIGPLKIIKEDRPGDVTWMQPPEYPEGNEKQQEQIMARVNEYFGRICATVPAMLAQLHQSGMILNFLANLGDGLTQVLQLCQQYISDEELALICGDDGIPIARDRREIQGKFHLELSFDPRDLDMEWLEKLLKMIVSILQMDTLNTIERDKLVQRLFSALSPELAAGTVRPVEEANGSEVKDEKNNFAMIACGIEPEMVAEGMNFPLRLQVLQGIGQQNPEAFQKLNPTSRKILEARMKYLENQVQQIKNAQIGRQVGQPALGGGQPAGISGNVTGGNGGPGQ